MKKFSRNYFNMNFLRSFLLFLFVFLLPTQLGIYFSHPSSRINGVFIDYLATPFFLTDVIFIFLTVFNLNSFRSKMKSFLLFAFLFFCILQLFLFQHSLIGVYTLMKYFQIIVLFLVFSNIRIKNTVNYLLLSGIFQLFIVLAQFISKSSIQGIFYFFGERYMTLSSPGIAKAVINGVEFLRPYGTFSHPNSMAGFFLLFYTYILFSSKKQTVIVSLSLMIFTLLIFLSFSKNSIIVYVLISVFYFARKHPICLICTLARISTAVILGLIVFIAKTDPSSLSNRIRLLSDSFSIIKNNFLFGTGLGQYLYYQAKLPMKESFYFLQPVHNILILFIAQSGIIIGSITLFFMIKFIYAHRKNVVFIACVSVIIITGMFDHYWLTLQQNLLVIGVVLGMSLHNETK